MTAVEPLLNRLLVWRIWSRLRQPYPDDAVYNLVSDETQVRIKQVLEPGASWTYAMARYLSREMDRNTLDLLSVTPAGKLGVGFVIGSSLMHTLNNFNQNMWLFVWLARFVFISGWIGTASAVVSGAFGFVLLWLGALLPAALLFVLHLYDMTLGGLLGMLFAYGVHDRSVVPVLAVLFHLLLVVAPLVVVLVLHSLITTVTGSLLMFVLLSAVNAGVGAAICEGAARFIWRLLLDVMDVSPGDPVLD